MNHTPWIDPRATAAIEKIIADGPRPFDIFEWGAGGSTIWFGKKKVGRVVSVDHDEKWYQDVKKEAVGLDVQVLLRKPTPEPGLRHSTTMPNMDFWRYINALSDQNEDFDLIMVDGRARNLCFQRAVYHVRNSGYIILHDSERKVYDECREVAKSHGFTMTEIVEGRSTLICQQP